MDSQRDNLRVALLVAAAASAAALIPIWPYGYYTLLRIVVTAVAVFAIVVLGNAPASRTVGLALFALLFNPFVPIHLTRALWFPFNLGVAVWFVYIAVTELSDSGPPGDATSGESSTGDAYEGIKPTASGKLSDTITKNKKRVAIFAGGSCLVVGLPFILARQVDPPDTAVRQVDSPDTASQKPQSFKERVQQAGDVYVRGTIGTENIYLNMREHHRMTLV